VVAVVRKAQYRSLKSTAEKRALGGEGARGNRQGTRNVQGCVSYTPRRWGPKGQVSHYMPDKAT